MTIPITRAPGSSLHHQLSTVLRSAILSGRYEHGDYLPGEHQLTAAYGVSRATVRRALLTLESELLVERQAGKGTRVLGARQSLVATTIDDHKRQVERDAKRTTVEVLGLDEIIAPAATAAALRLPECAPVVRVTRVRSRDTTPLRYMITYLATDLGRQLEARTLERITIVESLRRSGHSIERAEDDIGATIADSVLASALHLHVGDPLLEITRTMFDIDGTPLAYQWAVIPPQVFKLRVVIAGDTDMPSLADIGVLTPTARADPTRAYS